MVTDQKVTRVLDLLVEFDNLSNTRNRNKFTVVDWETRKPCPPQARPMDNAALKRKSMELTRALAELRKAN